ncbi:hypothetical protein RUND412_001090 [Rhizina undulata]
MKLGFILNLVASGFKLKLASGGVLDDEARDALVVVGSASGPMAGVEYVFYMANGDSMQAELPLTENGRGNVTENNTHGNEQLAASTPRHPIMRGNMRYHDPAEDVAIMARYPAVPLGFRRDSLGWCYPRRTTTRFCNVLKAWFADNGYDEDVLAGIKQEEGWEEGVLQYNTWTHVMQDLKRDCMALENDVRDAAAAGCEDEEACSASHLASLWVIAAEVGRNYLQPWDTLGRVGRLRRILAAGNNEDSLTIQAPMAGEEKGKSSKRKAENSASESAEDDNSTADTEMPNKRART